jgi:molybdate transport system permease protein
MDWTPLLLSLEVAAISTIIATLLGTGIAVLLVWKRLPVPDLIDAIFCAPLVLPPTVLGYYILVAVSRDSFIGRTWEAIFDSPIVFTFTGAVIAATVGSIPFVIRSARLGLESIEPNLIAAARTLGAGRRRVFFTVVLPLASPGVIAGAMLGFARALGDFGITSMVAGQRIDGPFLPVQKPTASIYVYNEIVGRHDDWARNMALVTTIVGVAMLYFANRLQRRLVAQR